MASTIQTQSYTTLLTNQAAAIQGSAAGSQLVDFSIGSVLRAIIEGAASVALWLQGLVLQVLARTRAATSNGTDLDSWVADYGVTRLGATAASGQVTFSRFTPTNQAVVPVGTIVQTGDGTQQFTVIADTTNSAYSAALNGFVIAANVSSVSVTVDAVNLGTQGNVLAGTITQIQSAIPGVDSVTNAAGFINGLNAESDAALRARFILFIASLSKATKTAIGAAVINVQQGLVYTITEDFLYAGTYAPGTFYVVVDDGSGSPPASLLTSVSNAIDATRAVGIQFAVFAPVKITANIVASITTASGYVHATVVGLVGTAIQNYINGLGLGNQLAWSRLYQVAYDASPGITDITGLTINGGTADLTATAQQVIRSGTVSIS